jgi:hypothetical protein
MAKQNNGNLPWEGLGENMEDFGTSSWKFQQEYMGNFATATQQRMDPREKMLRNHEERMRILEDQVLADVRLRKKSPALQEAWEQYQSIKRLVQ